MSQHYRIYIDTFEEVDWPRGRKLTYASAKRAVLAAGRFSVFEATETKRRAELLTRMAKDPRIVMTKVGFPWTKVERKGRRCPSSNTPAPTATAPSESI